MRGGIRGANRMQAGLRRRRAGAQRMAEAQDGEGDGRDRGRRHAEEEGEEEDEGQQKPTSRRDAYEARRAARDAEREAAEAAQEAELRKAAEERARREAEEAEKWMHTFTVEESGEEMLSREDGETVLEKMVEYLKKRKTVGLEEIAAEFGMRMADVIAKVKGLEEEKRITGVMDDRGKFIYVSQEEMESVAMFIRTRGRVAIGELAAQSSTLIDLEGEKMITEDIDILSGVEE